MIDNFGAVASILEDCPEDSFYQVTVCLRAPDFGLTEFRHTFREPGDVSHSRFRVLFDYTVRNGSELLELKEELVEMCRLSHGRSYLVLNYRNTRKLNLLIAQEVLKYENRPFLDLRNVTHWYNHPRTLVGKNFSREFTTFDIDTQIPEYVEKYTREIENLGYEKILTVPTRKGFHVITRKPPELKQNDWDLNQERDWWYSRLGYGRPELKASDLYNKLTFGLHSDGVVLLFAN